MHRVPFSSLHRTIAAGGEPKTRSEAHEAEKVLTIAEEAALEEWCLVMYRRGSPVRLDIFRSIAAAILEDRERRNIETLPNCPENDHDRADMPRCFSQSRNLFI